MGEGKSGRMRRGEWDRYDRSSDFALLEAQFRLLCPNAEKGAGLYLFPSCLGPLS